MNAGLQVVLSGTLTFGVPLVWAVREWIVTRRPKPGSWPGDEPRQPQPKPMSPDAPRRLPDCLIPRLSAPVTRSRILEPV